MNFPEPSAAETVTSTVLDEDQPANNVQNLSSEDRDFSQDRTTAQPSQGNMIDIMLHS